MSYTPPNGNNANLIFIESGYVAPAGFDADLILGLEIGENEIFQIYTDQDYVFAATEKGLDIYDITSEEKYAYINYNFGFNTVWGNDNKVFIGTTYSGIKYFNKTCISGSITDPINLFMCLNNFSDLTYYHNLTSNNIKYIHGYDDVLCAVTTNGVDVIKLDPQSYRSYTTINNGYKCFMTYDRKFYYTTSGISEWALNRMNNYFSDWDDPDYKYVTGSGIFEDGIELNDIFITENTAGGGINNTIFCATSSGVYIIDELNDNYDVYTLASGLKGVTNNFLSIWADNDASLTGGKFYVAGEGYFNVVNLNDQIIYDWYSTSHKGRTNEVLESSDIVDINVTK